MARTLEQVQAEIDALRQAMARGVLRVRHNDTETTYADPNQMRGILNDLLAEANSLGTTPTRQMRFATSKGLD